MMDVKTLQFFPWFKGTHQENKRAETAQGITGVDCSFSNTNKGRCSTLVTSGPVPSSGLVQCLGYLIC